MESQQLRNFRFLHILDFYVFLSIPDMFRCLVISSLRACWLRVCLPLRPDHQWCPVGNHSNVLHCLVSATSEAVTSEESPGIWGLDTGDADPLDPFVWVCFLAMLHHATPAISPSEQTIRSSQIESDRSGPANVVVAHWLLHWAWPHSWADNGNVIRFPDMRKFAVQSTGWSHPVNYQVLSIRFNKQYPHTDRGSTVLRSWMLRKIAHKPSQKVIYKPLQVITSHYNLPKITFEL